ncbi:MAG: hypothetical protein B6I20_10740 [Bacteroidetes bacterium 4572_117]|nr:MAG: hypothetical protein B6I20_10740 [Bacteroidetes bacterium 4572_117]
MRIISNKIFILLLLINFSNSAVSQKGYFQLRGRIISPHKDKLVHVLYKLYENGKLIDTTLTTSNGAFTIKFEMNKMYMVEFSKKAYTTKLISVNTKIPINYISKFYDRFNIIKLDFEGQGDSRSAAGLPVMKYFFDIKTADFATEKISNKPTSNVKLLVKRIKSLESELLSQKEVINQQKVELNNIGLPQNQENKIIIDAKRKADSILDLANKKAVRILRESKKDSINRLKELSNVTSDISNKDFTDLSVNKGQFKNRKDIKNVEKRIEELKKRQNKSATDSLDLKQNRLSLRMELVGLARAQLKIDRLKAKTREDSLMIEQREAQLFLIEQDMDLVAEEIENARKEILLKNLELQKKNLILYSVILGLILVVILLVVIFRHYQAKKRMNLVLEEQNKKLEEQNNLIVTKNTLLKSNNIEINEKNIKLNKQHNQIMDSINYGKRIQDAILPSDKLLNHFFSDFFVFFNPKDVVSGDFYWFSVQDDKLFVAAVDCTGHGVPGAFMSLIGNSLLNNIVNEKGIYKPSEILKELHIGVNRALSQSMSDDNDKSDGMDITLCRFEKSAKEVQLACANHTAFVVSNGNVEEIEGDDFSIADELIGDDIPEFTNHIIAMNKDTTLYMFSDGFPDQMGGPKNKKYYTKNLKKLFVENQKLKATDQKEVLSKTFDNWKGEGSQLDDVLVMGFKLDFG